MKILNQFVYLLQLAIQRSLASVGSYLALAFGVLVAVTTICGLIIYAEAINLAVLRDRLTQDHQKAIYDLIIQGNLDQMDAAQYGALENRIKDLVQKQVGVPITQTSRHGWSKSLLFIPQGVNVAGRREASSHTRFQFYSNLETYIDVIQGAYPQPISDPQGVVQVAANEKLAQKLGVSLGDEFILEDFKGGAQSVDVPARLTGIIRLKENTTTIGLYAPNFLDEAFVVPEETFFRRLSLTIVPIQPEFVWTVNYDQNVIDINNVGQVIAGLDQLNFVMKSQLGNLQLLTSLGSVLNDYRSSTFMLEALLVMLGAPVIGIALYYITMSAGMLVNYQRGEIAVLKSRGANNAQVLVVYLFQGLLLVVPIVLIAPFLALLLAQLIGKAETFMVFTNTRLLPVSLRPIIFGYAALTGLLTLLAIFIPTLRAASSTIVSYRREVARSKQTSFVHRFFIDILLLVLGGLGYRFLSQNRTIITLNARGGLEFDPLLLVTPMVLAVGLAFLALRALPIVFRLLARLDGYTEHIAPLFALRQVARSSGGYNGLVLIMTFTLALGLFTSSVAHAFDSNYLDQAMYATGADISTHEFDYKTTTWMVRPMSEYKALPGVASVSPLDRIELVGREATVIAKGTLLAVDLDTIAQTAWWRADFTPSLNEILAMLRSYPNAVVTDPQFASRNSLAVGQTFDIDVNGTRVDFVLAGTYNLFPSLFEKDGSRLITRFDYLQSEIGASASEVWLKTNPAGHAAALTALQGTAGYNLLRISDGHELAGVRKEDPLRTGLFGALSLGFVVASLLSILGFLLYAYINIQNRSLQFGVLRATGLSVNQLITTLSTEQLSLIAIGLLLGTILGGGAGWLFTSFLQVSIIARNSVPPFQVTIPWLTIGELYLILFGIFAIALVFSVYLLRKMRVSSVLRLGEQ